jgi:Fic family protein
MPSYDHIVYSRNWQIGPETWYELGQCRALVEAISAVPLRPELYERLLSVSLRKGARATTAIEGNTLSDEEIQRVVEGQPLSPSREYQAVEVRNVIDAMNALLEEVAGQGQRELISADLIRHLHDMIGRDLGAHFDAIPGQFRTDNRVVGTYRCPPPATVPELVGQLSDWLQREFGFASGRQAFRDAVVQAIVTHVYIEWIHPFGDGNGRTGRLVEFYILMRAGLPDIASHILSNHYNETRSEYYQQLDAASRDRDLTRFIAYAVQGFRDGLSATLSSVQHEQFKTAWRSFVYDRFADQKYRKTVFKRRRNLVLSMPLDDDLTLDDLQLVSPRVARDYAGVTQRTLQRDLDALAGMQLVRKTKGGWIVNADDLRQHMPKKLLSSQ